MKKVSYAWWVVFASFIILFFNSGARLSFGVIFKQVIEESGWSRGILSSVFLLNMTIFSLSLLPVGKLYDKHGPKWIIIVSTVFISLGFILTSFSHSIGAFFFSYGILSAIGFAGTSVPLVATLTSKWFEQSKGLAVSISLTGNCIGQFVLIPLFTIIAEKIGWRSSYLTMGLAIFFINTSLALSILKGDPEQLGYGQKTENEDGKKPGSEDIGLKEALKKSSLWLFLIMMFICGGGDFFTTTHFIPLATDYGISAIRAGNMLGWFGLMSLFGVVSAGLMSDFVGTKIPIILTFLIRCFLFMMIFASKSPISFYIFALGFGFTYLITAPLTPVLANNLYGPTNLGIITGLINTIHFVGGGVFAYIGGLIFDVKGDYQYAFLLMAFLSIVAAVEMIFLKEKRHKNNEKNSFC